jgi:hypothetical protein
VSTVDLAGDGRVAAPARARGIVKAEDTPLYPHCVGGRNS